MHLKGQRARHNSLTEESESLNFVVMLKKGNKQHFKGKHVKYIYKHTYFIGSSPRGFSESMLQEGLKDHKIVKYKNCDPPRENR